jgi:AcrR family transcriptional regulator
LTAVVTPKADRHRAERDAILKAAFRLIGRSHAEPVSVQQILDAAELSTRAFYRHFRSKDELIRTMCRTAADRVGAELADIIAAAPDPAVALRAAVHHQLAVVFDPKRARQTSVLSSAEARAAVGVDDVNEAAAAYRRGLLAGVIASGRASGVFPLASDPDEDARAVASVVGGLIQAKLAGRTDVTWDDATGHTTALFLRAFGAT